MTTVLLVPGADAQAPDLAADLRAAGIHVLGAAACDKLVQEVVRHAPDLLVCWAQPADEALFRALAMLRDTQPLPVLAFAQDAGVEAMERALEAGVHAWVVQGYAAQRLRPLVQLAIARFRREHGLREALEELNQRFEERKVVDRAKGILMYARRIPEDDAFRLLRETAMHAKQRVGQVAQQLVDSAQQAARVNRAGQLRMLSQRLVKLYALRVAGSDAEQAAALQARTVELLVQRLEQLTRLLSRPTFGDLLDGVLEAWAPLRASLEAPPRAAALLKLDAQAEALLAAAEALTLALEHAGAAPTLYVINLAGRQRMLSQRLAKEALLAGLLPEPAAEAARHAARRTAIEAEQALATLQAAPLSTAEIRATLAAAAEAWPQMLSGLDAAGTPEGRRVLARASEALLERFEELTLQVEQGMQALTGAGSPSGAA